LVIYISSKPSAVHIRTKPHSQSPTFILDKVSIISKENYTLLFIIKSISLKSAKWRNPYTQKVYRIYPLQWRKRTKVQTFCETRKMRTTIHWHPCIKGFVHNGFKLFHRSLEIFKALCVPLSSNTPHSAQRSNPLNPLALSNHPTPQSLF
jgi:hypothetical protein